jgi:hypothetical protein
MDFITILTAASAATALIQQGAEVTAFLYNLQTKDEGSAENRAQADRTDRAAHKSLGAVHEAQLVTYR